MSIYILEVTEDGEKYQYEYGNRQHAEEHYNSEKFCIMYEYNNGNYYFMKNK